ncbi:MAG: hypothetical protein Q9160_000298 [Pyrenula sp. 1 TL-2023]
MARLAFIDFNNAADRIKVRIQYHCRPMTLHLSLLTPLLRDADNVKLHTKGYSAYDCSDNTLISDTLTSYQSYLGGVGTWDLPEASRPSLPMSFHVDPIVNAPAGWDYRFYTRSDCSGFEDTSCALKPDAKGCISPPVGVWIAKVAIKAPATTSVVFSTVTVIPVPVTAKQKRTAESAVLTATRAPVTTTTTTVTATATP